VKIIQGGPDVNVPQLLVGGAADFGMGSNSLICLNMVKTGVPLRAVMAIFQKDPQVLMSHPRRDIIHCRHEGQTCPDLGRHHERLLALAARQVRLQRQADPPLHLQSGALHPGPQRHPGRLSHQRAVHGPATGRLDAQGLLLSDYGYPGYANMVLVPQKWIDTNRRAVQSFVDATRDGWLHYLTIRTRAMR
jgi:NitT/TauT family transport system substrate-binding protein